LSMGGPAPSVEVTIPAAPAPAPPTPNWVPPAPVPCAPPAPVHNGKAYWIKLSAQPDGTFTDEAVAAGIVRFDSGRGAALADFNLDGMLDLVEVNYGAPVRVWRNVGSGTATMPAQMGNWLAIRPSETGPNRDATGAWIEVRVGESVQRRELTIGGGHAGGQLGWTHFGLGPATKAQLRVLWPDGQQGPWMNVAANQFVIVEKGASAPRPWRPANG